MFMLRESEIFRVYNLWELFNEFDTIKRARLHEIKKVFGYTLASFWAFKNN